MRKVWKRSGGESGKQVREESGKQNREESRKRNWRQIRKGIVEKNMWMEVLVAAGISLFLYLEINFIEVILAGLGVGISSAGFHFISAVISVAAFGGIVRHLKKKQKNRLTTYFLMAILTSVLVVSGAVSVVMNMMRVILENKEVVQYMTETVEGQAVAMIFINIGIILLIVLFSLIFSLCLRPKIKYIGYISREVNRMEREGFGKEISVKGNDELAELTSCINNMSAALRAREDADKLEEEKKNRLIADISHDLRTPLTSIIGYTELVTENGFNDKEKFDSYMEVVGRRLGDLQSMIEQLFEYTKLTQSDFQLNKQKTNLTSLLNYVDIEYGNLYKKCGFKWDFAVPKEPVIVELDTEKFMRALGNLLENAKKYAVGGTEISMKVVSAEGFVDIILANETKNFRTKDLENLFERFYKMDESRETSGPGGGQSTGLGLPIAKKIVELHGGTLHVSLENERISFVMRLRQS
jgi:signal transduction histidine kinase